MLVLNAAARTLKDDGDPLVALFAPCSQTFEAIDHLEQAIVDGNHTNGQLRCIVGELAEGAGS